MRIRSNRVTYLHQTRSVEGAQLDDGIGDTLVSVYAIGSHLEAQGGCDSRGETTRRLSVLEHV
jgi:hypothetical protein